ncbi:MAG: ribonuclease H family protein [Bacteroidales bacterium]|nr:ribonuclease H family protein [Bacteroidales bacterium]
MTKNKYYVVWKGRHPGVFDDWDACKKEIIGCKGALYKGFPDLKSADEAFRMGYEAYRKANPMQKPEVTIQSGEQPITQAIAVDAACAGNPGKMEYRGVFVETKTEVFHSPVFENGTNNIGEFLAIVHALSLQKKQGLHFPIYSDSVNAQLWIRQKKCKTKLQPNDKNAVLFHWIEQAENWLANNTIDVPIIKWRTEIWGEIPADFGRK